MIERVEVAAGPGTVIRFGSIAAWVGPEASADLVNFLAQSARNVGPSPEGGRVLSDHLSGILTRRDPEPGAPFAVVGPVDDSWSLLLHGQVQAWDGSRWLYPSPDAHWTRCEIPAGSTLSIGGAAVALPRAALGTQMNLEAGVVPGGGMVVVGPKTGAVRSEPGGEPAQAGTTEMGAVAAAGLPEGELPEGDLTEADPPEGDLTEADPPEADLPEADLPEADLPEAAVAASVVPEASVPEATVPDASVPEATVPEAGVPAAGVAGAVLAAAGAAAVGTVAMGDRHHEEIAPDADTEVLPAQDLTEILPSTVVVVAEAGMADTPSDSEAHAVPDTEASEPAEVLEDPRDSEDAPTSGTPPDDEAIESLAPAGTLQVANHYTDESLSSDTDTEPSATVEDVAVHPEPPAVPEAPPRAPGPRGSLYFEALVAKAAAVAGAQPLARAGAPDVPVAGTPVVAGDLCPKGHLNRTGTPQCIRCGSDLTTGASRTTIGPRPPLGCLVTDDARVFRLDRSYIVGSDPGRDPTVRGGTAVPLRLEGPEVASAHAEIRLHDWDVAVTDRSSTAGTSVLEPGATEWERLRPFDPRILRSGSQIAFANTIVTFVGAWDSADRPTATSAPPGVV